MGINSFFSPKGEIRAQSALKKLKLPVILGGLQFYLPQTQSVDISETELKDITALAISGDSIKLSKNLWNLKLS